MDDMQVHVVSMENSSDESASYLGEEGPDARQSLPRLLDEYIESSQRKSGIFIPTTQEEFKKMMTVPGSLHSYMRRGGDPWKDYCTLPYAQNRCQDEVVTLGAAILKRCGLETKEAQGAKPKQHGAAQEMSSEAMMQHLLQCTDARGQDCHGSSGDTRVE